MKIHWQKIGGGSSRLKIDGKDRIIKPGEKFFALETEVPLGFRDVIIAIDGTQVQKQGEVKQPDVTGKKPLYTVKQRESGITIEPKGKSKTWFNVIKEGAELNTKALSKTDSESLKTDLEKESLWDVISPDGKTLNDKGLKKEIADKFKEDLEK